MEYLKPKFDVWMPGVSTMACPACVWGERYHSDWCPERPSVLLGRIDQILQGEGNYEGEDPNQQNQVP